MSAAENPFNIVKYIKKTCTVPIPARIANTIQDLFRNFWMLKPFFLDHIHNMLEPDSQVLKKCNYETLTREIYHFTYISRIYQFHVLIAMFNCPHLLFQMCHPDRHSRRSPRGSCRGWALLPALLHPLPHEWVVDKFSATFKFSLQFQPTVPGLRCPQAAISSFKIRRLNIHWTSLQAPRCTNVKAF